MATTYRKPEPAEAEAFAALHVQSWREAYASIVPAELMATFSTEKRLPMWQSVLKNSERFVLGAYVDGNPAGFIISGSTDEKHIEAQDGHLWAIYVLRAHARKGIGKTLLKRAAKDWLSRGGTTMTVGVLAENRPARAFYETMGARLAKTSVFNWDGYPLDDCIYLINDLEALTP